MLFVRSEWSYDKFHSKADRIYRMYQDEKYEDQQFVNTVTPVIMAPTLQRTFPEIENTCRLYSFNPVIRLNQNDFTENTMMVDSTFFEIFDFGITSGNRNNPFASLNSAVLTRSTAKKYFGSSDAVGKNVEMQLGDEKIIFTVSAITADVPEASSIKYNMLISYGHANKIFSPRAQQSWFNVYGETYVMLRKDARPAQLDARFPAMMKEALGEDYMEGGFNLYLQPIADIHLNNKLPAGIQPISNPRYSYILATIGILILLVACINFITLSIGRSSARALEVGVRKVMGASRQQLIRQFWGEAFLLTLASVLIGLGLSYLLLKPFNQIITRELVWQFDISFILFCISLIISIALIAGIYPALILSGFKPVAVLKGKLTAKGNTGWLRQSLVVGQFTASIAMIVCTIVIGQQMNYFKNKDLGYNKDQVIVVQTNLPRIEGIPLAELYRTELLKHPEALDATISMFSFSETPWVTLGFTNEKKEYRSFQYNTVDAGFTKAMNLKMKEGRSFDPANTSDITNAAVVNETFVKAFALKDPVGKKLPGPFEQQIIGVVKDFNFESLHKPVSALMMTLTPDSVFRRTENIGFAFAPQPRLSVRMKPGDIAANIKVLKDAWEKVAPDKDFDYKFLDEAIAVQYTAEQRTSTIVKIASGLSVFIACMGLFGLATLTVSRRKKEIGIRKVMGASVSNITQLLCRDFAKLVIIAAVMAFPLAWWFMHDWLKDFAYRVDIGWWVFAAAGIIALLIAILTVSFQAIKAAIANPVKSLRTE
jgi:putative ABC transport system permease protein